MVSILNTVRDVDRLRQITGVLFRHGFGEVVQRTGLGSLIPGKAKSDAQGSLAQRLRLVILDLGPSFIKLGQIVSTRPDLIPADIIQELKKLQDKVPPESFEDIREQIERDLGASIEELFVEFDEEPLASASVGQVHRAKLRLAGDLPYDAPATAGDADDDPVVEVVVKVQRPHIRKTIERDIDLLFWLARAVERSIPESRIYNPVKLVAEFDRAISAELDFNLEADNADRFRANFKEVPYARFPFIYRQASSKHVITMEFLDGKKIYDAVDAGASAERISKDAVKVIMKQIYEDGFFHADPHPGNIIIMGEPAEPVMAMIDLGLVGRLSPKMRDRTVDLMVAAVKEDYRGLADALYAIGHPTKKIDREAFEAEVEVLAQKYLGKKLEDIELSAMISDLVYGAQKYGIEIPPDFLMVGKALMTVEGVGKEIYPELDVFEEVKPYFLKLMYQRYSPERMTQEALRGLMRLSSAAHDLPLQAQEILDDLRQGKLSITVEPKDLRDSADRLGRRAFSGMLVSAMVLSGSLLITQDFPIAGGVMIGLATFWTASHSVWVAWLNRRMRQLRER